MQAIEFDTQIENGLIHLPEHLLNWQAGKHVKVIVLADESQNEAHHLQSNASINRNAGKLKLPQDPLSFQNSIRDEWS